LHSGNIVSVDLGKSRELVILSDVHVGAEAFDEEHFEETIRYINDKKAKVIGNGDLAENSIIEGKSAGEKLLEQKTFPTEQIKYIISKLRPIARRGDLVGIIRGNHESRTRREALLDICEIVSEALECNYLGVGGYLRFRAAKQSYIAAVQHGRSCSPNTWQELERMAKLYPLAEFVALGHDHQLTSRAVAYMSIDDNGKEIVKLRYQVRTGTYLKYADYARNMCLAPGEVGSPIISFSDNGHKIKVDTSTLSWIPV
jgi:predicted phosphodiesterase